MGRCLFCPGTAMDSSETECCTATQRRLCTWSKKVKLWVPMFKSALMCGCAGAGASPAQIDRALKQQLGLAMGIFEMFDLAGIDIGWRQRKEMGLTDPSKRDPSKRYSSLMDKLCEKGGVMTCGQCFQTRLCPVYSPCTRLFWSEDLPRMVRLRPLCSPCSEALQRGRCYHRRSQRSRGVCFSLLLDSSGHHLKFPLVAGRASVQA